MAKKAKFKKVLSWVLIVAIFASTSLLALKSFAPSLFCEHDYVDGVCIECEHECNHDFVDGVCEDCEMTEPSDEATE